MLSAKESLAIGCGILSVSTLLLTGYLVWRDNAPSPPCRVEGAEFDMGDTTPGIHKLEVVITNDSRGDCQILGMQEDCGQNCCYMLRDQNPVPIPAGASVLYNYNVLVKSLGPIDGESAIYLFENGSISEVPLKVTGNAGNGGRK